ncbi:hypothetical protein GE061_014265 [Apolygus lucorum]|uniref:Uncharacterized protein n=1 Tax=Apolygus lucorum TaxID=248454 RepID=A0A8S9XQ48_APOLU|nr:hypothetical protein GE061_014265 [Apolygus lucorum]
MGGVSVRSFGVSVLLCCAHLFGNSVQQNAEDEEAERYDWVSPRDEFPTSLPDSELPGGLLSNRKMKVDRGQYTLKEDLIVDAGAELILEPGVRISFAPTVGITVRGILTAKDELERSEGILTNPRLNINPETADSLDCGNTVSTPAF